ncbi:GPI transamidase component PIG-T-like [Ostrea edulis]|uniref:GPI transamidase component PIG-T-like n=1 Tax=Ostrea edulis TaxID=37623 RepID=UPI0024AFD518|nr:GPI transamidase component PIG-T-like [Ostrea edulis]
MAIKVEKLPGSAVKNVLFYFLTLLNVVLSIHNDKFSEELLIKPFPSGHVMFHFQFTTVWNVSIDKPETFQHYHLFPKSLGDVLTTYKVRELHLSQTQGLWKHEKWGYSPEDAPPGVELWVWFLPHAGVDQTWADLVNALSGLFCASLNFMDNKSTVQPRWSFRPSGLASEFYSADSRFVRYSTLPREVVCTENLTPWKKLLPCGSKIGLASLFNSVKVYDGFYHSLGVHIRSVCQDEPCSTPAVELKQTMTVVYDPSTNKNGKQDWSFQSIFDKTLQSQCPLAETRKIYVDVTSQDTNPKFILSPLPDFVMTQKRPGEERKIAVYEIGNHLSGNNLNLKAVYEEKVKFTSTSLPPVYANRFVTGYGLERGGVTCMIYNSMATNTTVIFLETVPWFLRVYFSSLKVENNGKKIEPYKINFIPAKDRANPYQMEIVFRLFANSVTKITYSFERAFLKWTEYPPDANHGFYVSSAVISTVLPVASQFTSTPQSASLMEESFSNNSGSFFLRLHTEALLVSLPTPDFSMPYNVICLACTVVAIAFGSLHNLTTRNFTASDPNKRKGLLAKLKAFFKKNQDETENKDNAGGKQDKSGTRDKSDTSSDKNISGEKDTDSET